MRSVIDHLGRSISIPETPQRIISLCPSITETLFDLGLEDRIVARTRYCIHPQEKVRDVSTVGGTKQVDYSKIQELNPDLIITEKEENPKEMVEQLAAQYPVYVVNVENYDDALRMILDLGEITNRVDKASTLAAEIEHKFRGMQVEPYGSVAYFIWRKPYMVAGRSTFINSILEKCGFTNAFLGLKDRYPAISIEDLHSFKPDYVFLSSEPFPFAENHKEELLPFWPNAKYHFVDGEIFSWYGSRMLKAPDYLNELLGKIAGRNNS